MLENARRRRAGEPAHHDQSRKIMDGSGGRQAGSGRSLDMKYVQAWWNIGDQLSLTRS
ncbi:MULTISPECIES: hypothetical protein [Mesorhizobium]|uniref:hypothetical protein n=1 Tax=Mesorhizobium TaxID=68287 RepID=UPI0012F6CB47|nr:MULTISPECIES: hypothetical protein [Mesorhizobium]MBZ9697012.1 hypothetical protein [Mesorhizobium sp. CO1-1-9]